MPIYDIYIYTSYTSHMSYISYMSYISHNMVYIYNILYISYMYYICLNNIFDMYNVYVYIYIFTYYIYIHSRHKHIYTCIYIYIYTSYPSIYIYIYMWMTYILVHSQLIMNIVAWCCLVSLVVFVAWHHWGLLYPGWWTTRPQRTARSDHRGSSLGVPQGKHTKRCGKPTVEGRNPAPPWMVETLKIMGWTIYQLVQDFFHPQYGCLRKII